jgi:3-hydroxyacyl-CoA dehydrogenase/enoyl-CoA hydratase/3-hydroxybutyryl-CoA epimerase
MVADGALGKKSGRGFYDYAGGERGKPTRWAAGTSGPPGDASPGELTALQKRLILPMINEAARCLEAGIVAEPWVIDFALVLGAGYAPFRGGPLRTADALGVERVVRDLEELRGRHGERFEPASVLRTAASGGGFRAAADSLRRREEVPG